MAGVSKWVQYPSRVHRRVETSTPLLLAYCDNQSLMEVCGDILLPSIVDDNTRVVGAALMTSTQH